MLAVVPPVVIVAVAALLVGLLGRRAGHAVGALLTAAVVPYVWVAAEGAHVVTRLFGFEVALFAVDPFTRLMGLIFAFIGAVAVAYSWATGADARQTAIALTYVASSLGAVFGGDWLVLIFFWELMAVTSTLLVWADGGRAVRAGFRYAVLHGIGGTLLLAAVIWQYAATGSFAFDPAGLAGPVAPVLAALGIGVNVGFIGLHAWLPDTYPRPHVAASVFLCVFTTKTGVYGLYRAFPEGEVAIAYMGGLMAVFGATYALFQTDMRRLLSYHIQSQVGYMVAGVGIGKTLAQSGAFAHVFNHILYKALLFMVAGVIVYHTGREDLKQLGGLAREMPVTAAAFAVAALSIAGFPLFNGFVSKGIVVSASHYDFQAGPLAIADFHTLELLLLIGGVGTFMSFMKFGYYAFLHGPAERSVPAATPAQRVALLAVAALCVLFGVADGALFALLPYDVTGEAVSHAYETYTVPHVVEGVALAAIALVGFAVLKGPLAALGRVPDIDDLYNPATLRATRALVATIGVVSTGTDRLAVASADRVASVVRDPTAALGRRPSTGIGASVFLVVVVLVFAVVLLTGWPL